MLFSLALIPVILLLVLIYFKDKNEKEPIGFLLLLFFAGMGSILPALIVEAVGEWIVTLFFSGIPVLKAYIIATMIVGPIEELGKFAVLVLITWRSRQFNYSFDAIVYAVFVSLGFAALENIEYVLLDGWGTGILRMFTAVPGHACFAVFMGALYSRAKYAQITKNKRDLILFMVLALVLPATTHGVYDAVVLGAAESENALFLGLSILYWVGFVLAMFAVAFGVVIWASKKDFCFLPTPEKGWIHYRPAEAGNWNCMCGRSNQLNFCPNCGRMRPMPNNGNVM